MKGFHLNPDEGNQVVPACEDDDKLKLCLPACVHPSVEHAPPWKRDDL
jgi:hypothetical protein